MSDDFQLSERGKRWIAGLRGQYKADMIDSSLLTEEELIEAGDFKIL